jgi:hypothetical protein
LRAWQDAAGRLLRRLPGPRGRDAPAPLDLSDLDGFLPHEPGERWGATGAPAYAIRGGRFVWEVAPFPEWRPALRAATVREIPARSGCPGAAAADHSGAALRRGLPRVRAWLLGRPPKELIEPGSLALVLPHIAVIDPVFARRMIDPRARAAAVRADADLTAIQRAQRLRLLEGWFFRNAAGFALARVLGPWRWTASRSSAGSWTCRSGTARIASGTPRGTSSPRCSGR